MISVTGASYAELGYFFRICDETVQKFVPDVTTAIVAELSAEVVNCSTTHEGWLEMASQFESRWNMTHCLGGLDGKHIRIRKPKYSGSVYFNYKLLCSIVPMVTVDANYLYISRTNS